MGFSVYAACNATLPELLVDAQAEGSDDTVAMNEIVRRFDRLTRKLARSMTTNVHDQQDIANAARVALVHAVRLHDLMRTGFPAYAEQHMRGAAARELGKLRDPKAMPTDPEILADRDRETGQSGTADVRNPWGTGKTARAVATLSEPKLRLLRQRYVEEMLLKDIAAASGTSVPAVSQRLATAHRSAAKALAAA